MRVTNHRVTSCLEQPFSWLSFTALSPGTAQSVFSLFAFCNLNVSSLAAVKNFIPFCVRDALSVSLFFFSFCRSFCCSHCRFFSLSNNTILSMPNSCFSFPAVICHILSYVGSRSPHAVLSYLISHSSKPNFCCMAPCPLPVPAFLSVLSHLLFSTCSIPDFQPRLLFSAAMQSLH